MCYCHSVIILIGNFCLELVLLILKCMKERELTETQFGYIRKTHLFLYRKSPGWRAADGDMALCVLLQRLGYPHDKHWDVLALQK